MMTEHIALGLVPAPRCLVMHEGRLVLSGKVSVGGPGEWIERFRTLVGPGTGLSITELKDADAHHEPTVRLEHDDALAPEAYRLAVDDEGVMIAAAGTAGLLHGIQTLRQLFPAWASGTAPIPDREVSLPHCQIEDEPRFSWRGMHLDVGRHFQPLDFLYRFVDLLALHKFNVFHLHLTEDQGWRFEVSNYPRLTENGAVRAETRYRWWDRGDGTPHGGFYTQDQLRALVGYAAHRGITIVPEIDLPGHVRALLAAYPELGEDLAGTGFSVATEVSLISDDVLHLTDATVRAVEDILSELLDVFPSEAIHLGGDECPKTQWRSSNAAQALAASRGLDCVDDLQHWFTEHLRNWLAQRGRRLVGWDEIVERGDVPDAIVMSWRGTEPGRRALAKGNDVVMTPDDPSYFDHYQSAQSEEPYAAPGERTLETLMAWDPAAGVDPVLLPHLLGVQGQLWGEYLHSTARVEYMAFPRAAALAEIAWSAPAPHQDGFLARLRIHLHRLDALGVNYRPLEGPQPWQRGGTGKYSRPAEHRADG